MFSWKEELRLGQEVWHIPGFRWNSLIAVRCEIVRVDDKFRRQHPSGFLFYDIDEPVGHSFGADELYINKEEALEVLDQIFLDEIDCVRESNKDKTLDNNYFVDIIIQEYKVFVPDLIRRRKEICDFIAKTHMVEGVPCDCGCQNLINTYKPKVLGVDWFYPDFNKLLSSMGL